MAPARRTETRAEVERRNAGGKREVVMVEMVSALCECLCAALAKKNKARRRSDLISARRHSRKLVPSGWGVGALLHFMSSQRKKERENRKRQRTAVLSLDSHSVYDGRCPVTICFGRSRHRRTAPVSDAFTLSTESGTSRSLCRREVRPVQSFVYLHLDLPLGGYFSAHVQRISIVYAAFGGLETFCYSASM
ncbi:hypothetical protein KUCAC02_031186 [Chaenocephalus aceratus]|uniref:Uncharacterized protein n=1 Tax=Chaenocephalus aceratus TaxID=36190 RepID=A0ACB9XMC6_CHAAC|nr:hypothetical protein KUCAC02_031186 [Chaenocephalus aceratus]